MNDNQIFFLTYLFLVVMRFPRIAERWKAPLLRGPEWFFNVPVPPDFFEGPGAAILRFYRALLFIPWAIELPLCAAIFAALGSRGRFYVLCVIGVITLYTRLNAYLARSAAENRARRILGARGDEPPVAVALSLQTRTLAEYTNWWIEAAIAFLLVGSVAWLAYRYATSANTAALRGPWNAAVIAIYLQAGLLLLKRAYVRARTKAPVEGAEQYLEWRDSLRRLSTAICDYIRIGIALLPPAVILASAIRPWQGSAARIALAVLIFGLTLVATFYEWRYRLRYLEAKRRTRPANFLIRPDVPDAARFICFRPSLPVLLLSSPKGYAVNLASAPAKVAGLYLAGCAALWIVLMR